MTADYSNGIKIDTGKIYRLIDIPNIDLHIRKMDMAEVAQMNEMWKEEFRRPVGKADNDPSYVYATVKVRGEVVATIYNGGSTETSNDAYSKIRKLPSMGEDETLTGPALAAKRAREIAEKLGGTVEMAPTAMTDAQWEARPPMEWTYDYEAMESARKERDAQIDSSKSYVDAQIIGQSGQPYTAVQALITKGLTSTVVNRDGAYKDELFKIADVNNDGNVTRDELRAQVVAGGGTQIQADGLYDRLNGNKDDTVSKDEFISALPPINENKTFGEILSAGFDRDKDSVISRAEFKATMIKAGKDEDEIDSYANSIGLMDDTPMNLSDFLARLDEVRSESKFA